MGLINPRSTVQARYRELGSADLKRCGAAEACLAHNQKVTGSKPVIANIILAVVAQSVERKTFNLVVVGSIPTDGRRIGDNHLK